MRAREPNAYTDTSASLSFWSMAARACEMACCSRHLFTYSPEISAFVFDIELALPEENSTANMLADALRLWESIRMHARTRTEMLEKMWVNRADA